MGSTSFLFQLESKSKRETIAIIGRKMKIKIDRINGRLLLSG